MLREGDKAPDFSGQTADGKRIGLADFRGKQPLVLYFYPKDNTPGCTREACAFRDNSADIAAAGGAIVCVSTDTAESHGKFASSHGLNFPLIADVDGRISKAFGAARLGGWLPSKRATFVIDREGTIRRVIHSELGFTRHVEEALDALKSLPA